MPINHKNARTILLFLITAIVWAVVPVCAEDLSVVSGENGTIQVKNDHYKVVLNPAKGGVITSLRFGAKNKIELTHWEKGTQSGLVSERNTAGMQFNETGRQVKKGRAELTMSASTRGLQVVKTYRFMRDSAIIHVNLRFKNTSAYPLAGYDAPSLANLISVTGKQSGNSYYCMSQNGRPRIVPGSSALKKLNRTRTKGMDCHWVGVTDPARQYGLGVVFKDSAHACPSVSRNGKGRKVIRWDYGPIPANAELETSFLLVPFEGLSAISEMNDRFVADTVVAEEGKGNAKVKMQVDFMPLRQGMKEVSIVSRAYDSAGRELQPCEPLMYENVAPHKVIRSNLVLSGHEKVPAWLMYEVYVQGKKLGEFLGKVQGGKQIPDVNLRQLPPPKYTETETDHEAGEPEPSRDVDESAFDLINPHSTAFRTEKKPLNLRLVSNEKETVFLGVRARTKIPELNMALNEPENKQENGLEPLPPSARYTWLLKKTSASHSAMVPYEKRQVQQDNVVWMAFTIDTTGLQAGSYGAELVVAGADKKLRIPVQVRVSNVQLPPKNSFALWYAGLKPEDDAGKVLRSLAASGLIYYYGMGTPNSDWSVKSMARETLKRGYDRVAFASPGMGLSIEGNVAPLPGKKGVSAQDERSIWQLWAQVDSPGAMETFRQKGFSLALMTDRLSRLSTDPAWGTANISYFMVENGCELGRAPALIKSGKMSAQSSVWCVLDLRQSDWKDVRIVARRAMWAAAWQGLAGVVIVDEFGKSGSSRQSAMWHVLRDIREETGLYAAMLDNAKSYSEEDVKNQSARLNRAEMLTRAKEVVGRAKDCTLRVRSVRHGLRTVPRAYVQEKSHCLVKGFWKAKAKSIDILSKMRGLTEAHAPSEGFYRPARNVK